jgi:hypothetical protein
VYPQLGQVTLLALTYLGVVCHGGYGSIGIGNQCALVSFF